MKQYANTYKNLFSHKEMVQDLLCGFVQQDWVARLNFETLERVEDSFVTDDIRDREDDIIWRVRLGDSWIYVYLLIEFQSTVDTSMPVRIMTYVGLLYQDLLKTGRVGSKEKLPPVLPIVLYNGSSRWNAPVELFDMIASVGGGLEIYTPRLRFLLLDEGAYQDSELEPLKNLVAALFRLENSPSPEKLREIINALLDWLKLPEQQSLLRAFIVWFRRVMYPHATETDDIPRIENSQEAKVMLAERVAQWAEEIRRKSAEEAEEKLQLVQKEAEIQVRTAQKEAEQLRTAQKEAEIQVRTAQKEAEKQLQTAKREAKISLLTKLLKLKFGTLPAKYHGMIETAGLKRIEKWAEKILTANTLTDVFDA